MDDKEFNKIVGRLYGLCIESQTLDDIGMFEKFKQAQWLIIDNITKIESAKKSMVSDSNDVSRRKKLTRQILTLKDFANSIAWVITGATSSGLRAYYGSGGDLGYISEKNIDTSLRLIREYESTNDAFILLTDITTAINIGDILVLKLGKPPITLELKEGEKNAQLLTFLKDGSLLMDHLSTVDEKERRTTQKHFKRLQNQHKRMGDLNEYLKDESRRYDEYLDTYVQVVEQTLESKTYKRSIQNAYNKMHERIKTLKLSGGLSVLIAKSPYTNDDVLYFKHTIYHRTNGHRKTQCVIKNEHLGADVITREMEGIMSIEIGSWMQNIGKSGYTPLTTALDGFSRKLAVGILTCKITLYIYMDIGRFIECLKQAGLQVQLEKPLGGSHLANALVIYEKKNVSLNEIGRLTLSFHDRVLLNFSHPLHEVAIQKELIEKAIAFKSEEIEAT